MKSPVRPSAQAASRVRAATITNQEHVLRALHGSETPLKAYDILRMVKDAGITAPLSVYRALKRLMEDGRVHRLESLNAYVACNDRHHEPVVFAICRGCGHVEELAEDDAVCRLHEAVKRRGFRIEATMIEVNGQCASCATG